MFVTGCFLNLFPSFSPTSIKCVPFHKLVSLYYCCLVFPVSLLYVPFSPSVSYSSQINWMKFLQQLNRQSALMRHRGHGDRGRKETGGEVSMAMRCVSEACD